VSIHTGIQLQTDGAVRTAPLDGTGAALRPHVEDGALIINGAVRHNTQVPSRIMHLITVTTQQASTVTNNSHTHNIKKFGNIGWFTNLDIKKRHEDLILYKKYTPEEYPKYDDYDAINVDKVKDIPIDYDGVMGVPITFLDYYNPDQFEIVGTIGAAGKYNVGPAILNGKAKFKRILIKRKK